MIKSNGDDESHVLHKSNDFQPSSDLFIYKYNTILTTSI